MSYLRLGSGHEVYLVVYTARHAHDRHMRQPSPVSGVLAEAIRERRLALGMGTTQQVVAQRAHISLRHLQKIERGSCTPRLETLAAISSALRTSVQGLLDRAEQLRGRRRRR